VRLSHQSPTTVDILAELYAVITEGSFLHKGGMVRRDKTTGKLFGHKGIPDWINLFCDKTSLIIFMHFGAWFFDINLTTIFLH